MYKNDTFLKHFHLIKWSRVGIIKYIIQRNDFAREFIDNNNVKKQQPM